MTYKTLQIFVLYMNKNSPLFFAIVLIFSFQNIFGQNDTLLAKNLKSKADSLSNLGIMDSTIHYYTVSSKIFNRLKMHEDEMACYKMQSICFLNNRNNPDSTYHYANVLLNRAKEIYGDSSKWLVDAYILRALSLNNLAGYHEGIANLKKALWMASKFYPWYHVKTGLIYGNLGIQYYNAGKYGLSIDSYYKALDIDRKLFGEEHQTIAINYNNIGITYSEIGMADSAITFYKKALSIWEKLFGKNFFSLSDNYTNLAVESLSKGDYYQAILYENKSLQLRLANYGEEDKATALCYSNLGVYHEYAHNYSKALEYQKKALELRLKILPAKHPALGNSYINLASIYRNLGKYNDALAYQQKALAIKTDIYGNEHSEVAEVKDYIADIYRKQKKYDMSVQTYHEAIQTNKISFNTENHPKIAGLYNDLAKTYSEMLWFDSVIVYVNKAITANYKQPETQLPEIEWQSDYFFSETVLLKSLSLKGKSLYQKYLSDTTDRKSLEMSFDIMQMTIALINEIKKSYVCEESKLFFSDNISEIFQRAVDITYTLYALTGSSGYAEKMFQLIKKSKSGILYENLSIDQTLQNANIPDSIRLNEKLLGTEINSCRMLIANAENHPDDTASLNISSYQEQLIKLQDEYQSFIDNLEEKYPKFRSLRNQTGYCTLKNIKSEIDENTILLDYFISDSAVYCYAIENDTVLVTRTFADSTFKIQLVDFLKTIKTYNAEKYAKISPVIYNYLIQPVSCSLQSKKHIVVIPDKYLFYLPFGTLCKNFSSVIKFSDAGFLIKKYDLNYHYNAGLFVQSLKKKQIYHLKKNSFVGFAPIFKDDIATGYMTALPTVDDSLFVSEAFRSISVNGKILDELIYSKKEIKDIESVFKSHKYPATSYFASSAQEKTFRNVAGNYKYIHIATHGILNDSIPRLSGLVFASPNSSAGAIEVKDDKNSGILYNGEIQNLNLEADLLVLSACETGMGKIINGEGIMSLTHSFLTTGVPNVVLSLWKVGDKSTMELMVQFYAHFLEGATYAEALRKAKLNLISNEKYAFPKHWGAFILIGSN